MKMRAGCCKDVHANIKLNDNHKAASQIISPNSNTSKQLPDLLISANASLFLQTQTIDISNYHPPPLIRKLPVFLVNENFRI